MSLTQTTFSLGSPASCGRKDLYFSLFSTFIPEKGIIANDRFKQPLLFLWLGGMVL